DGDAEFDLFLRVRPRVGRQRRRRGSEKQQEGHDAGTHGWKCLNIRQPAPPRSVKRRVAGRRTKVRLSKAYATEVRRKTSNSTANYFVRRPLVSRPVHCFATRLSQLRVNGRVIIPSRSGARALSSRSAMSPDEAVALSFAVLSELPRTGLTDRLHADDPNLLELARSLLPRAHAVRTAAAIRGIH